MKRIALLLFLLLSAASHAKALRVVVDSKQFFSPKSGTYIEFYMQFLAKSIHFQGDSLLGYSTAISTQIIISQDEKIVQFDKFKIEKSFDTNAFVEDIYSLKRFSLNPGIYEVEYVFIDLNNSQDTILFTHTIEVEKSKNTAFFSNVLLAESITKAVDNKSNSTFFRSGYDIIPRLVTYYNVESERLIAYIELYNSHLNADLPKFAIRYFLRDNANGRRLEGFSLTKVYNAFEVIPLMVNMNIAELATGSYSLNFELLDRDEKVVCEQSIEFDKHNPTFNDVVVDFTQTIVDPRFFEALPDDSIFFFLESLTPISSRADVSQIYTVIDSKDVEVAKKFFQAYWIRTSSKEPTDAWIKYKKLVVSVQKEYGTLLLPGFKSDRGRVFLQHGPPSARIQRPNEPGEYPYEVWQYYKIGGFSNRRFIFFNPVGVGNEYVLLHSDMPGELFNNRYLQDLSRTGVPVRTRVNDEGVMDGARRQ